MAPDPMEKRVAQLPAIRVGESLEQALMRLAARDERSLSDYLFRLLWRHAFGHAATHAAHMAAKQRLHISGGRH